MVPNETDDVWRTVVPTLEPLERRALAMIYLDGLTQRQVAQQLGRQRTDVSAAVARAVLVIAASVEAATVDGVITPGHGSCASSRSAGHPMCPAPIGRALLAQ